MPFDPDFGKSGFARHLFRLRFRDLKLSQRAFADRFGLSYSVVRDAEQGAKPTRALLAGCGGNCLQSGTCRGSCPAGPCPLHLRQ